jgi:hypothetical protein
MEKCERHRGCEWYRVLRCAPDHSKSLQRQEQSITELVIAIEVQRQNNSHSDDNSRFLSGMTTQKARFFSSEPCSLFPEFCL